MDANLIGGDIGGGAVNLRQFLFRPTHRQYRTSAPGIYLCSSSTPPGGGVHGMCGANAARIALRHPSANRGARRTRPPQPPRRPQHLHLSLTYN